MVESADDLRSAINEFYTISKLFCIRWKVNVNVNNNKITVFSKGLRLTKNFYYKEVIENVK